MADGLGGAFPIGTTISDAFSQDLIGNLSGGDIYLLVILASVFVCTLAIQGAATRLMFSMGRDRHLPFGGTWGHVNTRFRTPANAAVGGRRHRRPADPRRRPGAGRLHLDRRDRA